MKNKSIFPLLLIGIGGVLFFVAIIFFVQARNPLPSPQSLGSEEETFPEIPRVSLTDGLSAYETEAAIFIDVRDRSAYEEAHIPGSLSFPLAQLDSQLKDLDPNAWIITYCT